MACPRLQSSGRGDGTRDGHQSHSVLCLSQEADPVGSGEGRCDDCRVPGIEGSPGRTGCRRGADPGPTQWRRSRAVSAGRSQCAPSQARLKRIHDRYGRPSHRTQGSSPCHSRACRRAGCDIVDRWGRPRTQRSGELWRPASACPNGFDSSAPSISRHCARSTIAPMSWCSRRAGKGGRTCCSKRWRAARLSSHRRFGERPRSSPAPTRVS